MTEQKNPAIIEKLIAFHSSRAYPVYFAMLCAVSGLYGKTVYIPILFLLSASILFCAFYVKASRVFLVPMLLMYYALGADTERTYYFEGDVLAVFDSDAFDIICLLAVINVAILAVRFSLDGTFKNAFKNRGIAFWGIFAMCTALIIGGALSEHWTAENLLWGGALAILLFVFYLVINSIISQSDKDIIKYVCFITVCLGYIVFFQVICRALPEILSGSYLTFSEANGYWAIARVDMAWGISTVVGGVSVLGIPAALVLARDERHPLPYYLSALVFLSTSMIINIRSAMIAGIIILIMGASIICASGKNRIKNRIITLSLIISAAIVAVALCIYISQRGELSDYIYKIFLSLFRPESIISRFEVAYKGLQDFISYPVLGVGISKGVFYDYYEYHNIFTGMCHNVIAQFLATAGVTGGIAFVWHIKDLFVIWIKKINSLRSLILLMPLLILTMSLADNFFFYLNFQIAYVAFIALAQKELSIKNG